MSYLHGKRKLNTGANFNYKKRAVGKDWIVFEVEGLSYGLIGKRNPTVAILGTEDESWEEGIEEALIAKVKGWS